MGMIEGARGKAYSPALPTLDAHRGTGESGQGAGPPMKSGMTWVYLPALFQKVKGAKKKN